MENQKKNSKNDVLKRLRRIEGQIKGIQKMIEEDKNCSDILTQVAAVRAAINKVGGIIIENHSVECIEKIISSEDRQKAMNDLTKVLQSFMKFYWVKKSFIYMKLFLTNILYIIIFTTKFYYCSVRQKDENLAKSILKQGLRELKIGI